MENDGIMKLKYCLQKGGLNYWDWLCKELQEKILEVKIILEIEEENFSQKLITEIYFKTRRFQITYNPSLPNNISWSSANLYIPDMISGGSLGRVKINYYQEKDYTYLQTVVQLEKKEFEIIFGLVKVNFTKIKSFF